MDLKSKVWTQDEKMQLKHSRLNYKQYNIIKCLLAPPKAEIKKGIDDLSDLGNFNIPWNTPGWIIHQKLKHYNLLQEPSTTKHITRFHNKLQILDQQDP